MVSHREFFNVGGTGSRSAKGARGGAEARSSRKPGVAIGSEADEGADVGFGSHDDDDASGDGFRLTFRAVRGYHPFFNRAHVLIGEALHAPALGERPPRGVPLRVQAPRRVRRGGIHAKSRGDAHPARRRRRRVAARQQARRARQPSRAHRCGSTETPDGQSSARRAVPDARERGVISRPVASLETAGDAPIARRRIDRCQLKWLSDTAVWRNITSRRVCGVVVGPNRGRARGVWATRHVRYRLKKKPPPRALGALVRGVARTIASFRLLAGLTACASCSARCTGAWARQPCPRSRARGARRRARSRSCAAGWTRWS